MQLDKGVNQEKLIIIIRIIIIIIYFINLHRVREKKRPEYSRHNFDKFRHSFVIFGTNHPDTPMY